MVNFIKYIYAYKSYKRNKQIANLENIIDNIDFESNKSSDVRIAKNLHAFLYKFYCNPYVAHRNINTNLIWDHVDELIRLLQDLHGKKIQEQDNNEVSE